MAQYYFKYGSMNSGKSIEILKIKHNYEERDRGTILMTSSLDNRYGENKVASRLGISQEAIAIHPEDSILELLRPHSVFKKDPFGLGNKVNNVYCILIDEAQFLTENQVKEFAYIVDEHDIPVMAFGLKNDFQNKLFEGSQALLTYADKIEEIKTICHYCHHKAIMNLRMIDDNPVYDGEQVQIGGNESYVPVCRKHYRKGGNHIG